MSARQTILIATVAVLVLVGLTAVHLDRQGMYYDELHQAPAAFRYLGRHPIMFTWAYRGVPLMNMTYSGAIKSNIYGQLLKYVLPRFTITSWRWLGIIFVASGLIGFYWIAGRWIPIESGVTFTALLLTDITVVLTTRHDWGPTALALALRLVFIGLWIAIECDKPSTRKVAAASFIVGLSIYEKLSSVVLVFPLAVLLFTARTLGRKTWLIAGAAFCVGVFPLVIANVATYRLGQGFISLADTKSDKDPFTVAGLKEYVSGYFSLGHGEMARAEVLGETAESTAVRVEAWLNTLALLTVSIACLGLWKTDNRKRLSLIFVGIYVAIAIGLLLLPRATFIHHWIIGTPFQYAAMALALPAMRKRAYQEKFLTGLLLCLIAFRIPTLVSVERALIAGQSSAAFSPVFNELIRFAGRRADTSIFISSDWGSATQLYCGVNGAENTVYETFWGPEPAKGMLNIAEKTKKNTMYIVTTGLDPRFSDASHEITQAMLNAPDWKAVPVDEDAGNFSQIQIRKFVRQVK